MKIVFLAPFGIRPKGTLLARMLPLAVELQKLRHETIIIAPPYTNPEDSGRVEICRGVRIVNVRLAKGGKAASALPLAWRMLRSALYEKPDLVHLFKPKGYGGLAAMVHLVLRKAGVRLPPLFVDSDDREGKGGMNELHSYSPAERMLYCFQENWLLQNATGVTVASRELQRLTEGLGVVPERVLYLPNCVEDLPAGDGGRIRERLGISSDTPLLLLYTRFFEFSQERLHRVLAGIHQLLPAVRFLVVGKGRRGEEGLLGDAARAMGFTGALVMAGWVEPVEIPDYLTAADAAIYPLDDTLVNRAKCPAKLTEIIRCGVPVVADRVGQASEYLTDREMLSDPANAEEMIAKTVALLNDRGAAEAAGAAAKDSVLKAFLWDHFARQLEGNYAMVLQKSTIAG